MTDLSLIHRTQDKSTTSPENITAKPAILLTDDRTIRVMAKAEKLAALTPTVLRKYLGDEVTSARSALSLGLPSTSGDSDQVMQNGA